MAMVSAMVNAPSAVTRKSVVQAVGRHALTLWPRGPLVKIATVTASSIAAKLTHVMPIQTAYTTITSCTWIAALKADLIAENAFLPYTTLMHTHLTLGLVVTTLVLTAVPALAQEEDLGAPSPATIEDMLLQQALSGQRHIDGRMSARILQMQEQVQLDKLAAAEAAKLAAQSSSVGVLHTAATEESTSSVPTLSADDSITVSAGGQTVTLSAASLRLLARLQNRSTSYANPALHSGAPLAPTGPGTILAVFVLALAVCFTYLRAWMLEKKHRD